MNHSLNEKFGLLNLLLHLQQERSMLLSLKKSIVLGNFGIIFLQEKYTRRFVLIFGYRERLSIYLYI